MPKQTVRISRSNFENEIDCRIQLGWTAFRNSVSLSKISQCLKTKVLLPVMTCGTQTWSLTKGLKKLKVAQRVMERPIL